MKQAGQARLFYWAIGRLADWAIGRFGDLAMLMWDVGYGIMKLFKLFLKKVQVSPGIFFKKPDKQLKCYEKDIRRKVGEPSLVGYIHEGKQRKE